MSFHDSDAFSVPSSHSYWYAYHIIYICIPMPVHIIWCLIIPTVGSSMLLVLKQDLEAKNGGKVETAVIWWLEEQRCYLCGHRFEGLIHGSRILLSIQNNLHFTVMLCYYIKDSKTQCVILMWTVCWPPLSFDIMTHVTVKHVYSYSYSYSCIPQFHQSGEQKYRWL